MVKIFLLWLNQTVKSVALICVICKICGSHWLNFSCVIFLCNLWFSPGGPSTVKDTDCLDNGRSKDDDKKCREDTKNQRDQ